MKEKPNRNVKGQFLKGHKGTGGRPKGIIQDLLSRDGKKISVNVLLDDMLGAYAKMGGGKFLAKWATQNHRNLSLFIQLLAKFIPMPTQESTLEFKPLIVKVERVITNVKPGELEASPQFQQTLENQVRELRQSIIDRDNELSRMRKIFTSHGIEYTQTTKVSHEVLKDKELPSHEETEEDEEEREEREYKDETDRRTD